MAKRGRKPQAPYVTMWKEVIEGVRKVILEKDARGAATVWRLYPTGKPEPYFGTVRKDDLESERKAVAKFERWKQSKAGTPWEQEVKEEPLSDSIWVSIFHEKFRDRRIEHLVKTYVARYRTFIRDLILADCRKAALELDIEQLAWFEQLKPPVPSLPLKEAGDLYFNRELKMSPHWKRKMRRMWEEFVNCVGVKTVREITADAINHYHDLVFKAYNKGKSPTYVFHRFTCPKTVFRYAMKRGKDQEQLQRVLALCAMLTPPGKATVKSEPIAVEHYRKLLEAVEDEPKWKAIFLLALNGAMYPSEVAAVKKSAINLDEGTLVMDRGKTGVLRVAVLWRRTVEAIREYQAAHPHHSEYVFVSRSGAPFGDNHISRNFTRRRDALGLPTSVQFAHIRDGAYSAAFNADGVEEKHAKVLAGHRSGMSDHYVKRNPRVVATACAAIERHYFGEAS